ncbi:MULTISPECIES: ABC transporter substrate-binding protein [unclassified Variovorax]|uniref:ABC transporter substrate-binding protein n=1 Tax=unclassified Variovorax TaxID=663243 RepID=UPI001BD43A16|nr:MULTISPECIES: ABC transporter substrate-binding protein [unclassified Variovorax]
MIDRRGWTKAAFAAIALGVPLVSASQSGEQIRRIGFLSGGPRPPDGLAPAPLRNALDAAGSADGRRIVYEARWSQGHPEQLPGLAAELVALKVDAIVTVGGPPAAVAKQATKTVPVVVINAGDVVETGLVASLAHPGGNITGIDDPAAVLSAKRLEFVKELVPRAQRVAVLWNAGDGAMTLRFHSIEKAAPVLGVAIDPLPVREPDDFNVALAAMNKARPDAVMMITDALTILNRKRVIDYAAMQRIPAVYEYAAEVRAGGLLSYGADAGENMALAADYVYRIIKGAKPADLPVAQPKRYHLTINMSTASSLGLSIPTSLLIRADEVIP